MGEVGGKVEGSMEGCALGRRTGNMLDEVYDYESIYMKRKK